MQSKLAFAHDRRSPDSRLHLRPQARSIVIVLHDLPLGGSERIAIRLANRWVAEGRQVTLLVGSRKGPLDAMIAAGVEVVECSPPIPRSRGSRELLGRATAAFLSGRRTDVLFVPGNYHWRLMPAVAALPDAVRPKMVAQIGTPLYRHGRGRLQQVFYNHRTRRQFAGVDAAISLSPAMTAEADRILGRQITTCLRLPAVDDDAPLPVAADADSRLIVAAGRLVREKGFEIAIRAFALLDDPSARLVILGEGPERKRLLAQAQAAGVADRVELPGYVPDIRPWLDRARAFLLTSYYEGYGAVIVEALAAGRPVVTTNCTHAVPELLARRGHGAVAPIGDAVALADGLRRVLDAPPPDPAALSAGVGEYCIGPVSDAYLAMFDSLLERRAGSDRRSRLPLAELATDFQRDARQRNFGSLRVE